MFFFNYYYYFLVFTASHDTQSRGDAARRPSVGSRCCISTCQCLLARLLRKREVSAAAVTLGNTCWQCRLHTSGLSATGAIDSHQVICDAFLRVWQFVFVFICLIYLFGGKRKKKKRKWDLFFVVVFFKKWMSEVGVEGAHDRWHDLFCGAVVTTERHLDVCVTPRPCTLSHKLCCTSSSSYRVVLQENVCHQPLNMCLNDISPVCVRERLSPRETSNVFFCVDG